MVMLAKSHAGLPRAGKAGAGKGEILRDLSVAS